MKQLSLKRGFCLMLSVVVSCFFMLVFFCNLSHNSLKASASASDYGGYSGWYNGALNSVAIASSLSYSGAILEGIEIAKDIDVGSILGGTSEYTVEDVFTDLFYMGLNCLGAVFSSDTDVSEVKNIYNTWISSKISDDDISTALTSILYYGTDGELHFTDEFIDTLYSATTAQAYQLGVVQIPPNTNETVLNYYLGTGSATAKSSIISGYSSSDFTLLPVYTCLWYSSSYDYALAGLSYSSANQKCFFSSDLTFSSFTSWFGDSVGFVCPFSNYSGYETYLSYSSSSCSSYSTVSSSSSSSVSLVPCYVDSSSDSGFSSASPVYGNIYCYNSTVNSSTGSYDQMASFDSFDTFTLISSFPSGFNSSSDNRWSTSGSPYSMRFYLLSSSPVTVYTSTDWFAYYNVPSETTGLVGSGGVAYCYPAYNFYNSVNPDTAFNTDWESLYNTLQAEYEELLEQGNTLEEIKSVLEEELQEIVPAIESGTGDITEAINDLSSMESEYFSSFNSLLKSINSKLTTLVTLSTVDTVVDTVTALTSLVGAAEDFVDDIVDDVLDGTFDTVLDALIESEYYTDLLSSFNSAFPFSLPYDFFLIVNLLAHDPVTPEITWRMKFDSIGFDEVYSYDFSAFDSLASVTRVFSSLLFIVALIKITMRLRKKE